MDVINKGIQSCKNPIIFIVSAVSESAKYIGEEMPVSTQALDVMYAALNVLDWIDYFSERNNINDLMTQYENKEKELDIAINNLIDRKETSSKNDLLKLQEILKTIKSKLERKQTHNSGWLDFITSVGSGVILTGATAVIPAYGIYLAYVMGGFTVSSGILSKVDYDREMKIIKYIKSIDEIIKRIEELVNKY